MPTTLPPGPGERYTIRRKVFKVFGAGFHIYGPDGGLVGYCKQKAFKFREDLRIYTDDSCTQELMRIRTKEIIDVSATYIVTLPTGETLGSFRQKGMKSLFFRDHWLVFGASGQPVGELIEDSGFLGFARRYIDYVSLISPQKFALVAPGADLKSPPIARFRQHFNLFVYRLGVSILKEDAEIDDLLVLALGCIVAAIEGRQS